MLERIQDGGAESGRQAARKGGAYQDHSKQSSLEEQLKHIASSLGSRPLYTFKAPIRPPWVSDRMLFLDGKKLLCDVTDKR